MKIEYILYHLNKAKKIMHQYVDVQLKKEGFGDLVSAYTDIVTVLFMNEGKLKMNEISHMVGKDKSTVTVLINRLIDKGYVQKEKSTLDKRVTYVILTDKALSHKAALESIASEVTDIAFKGFTDEEHDLFKSGLIKLEENFVDALRGQ